MANDNLRDKLITYLQDAHAMEHQIIQMLEGQVKDTEKYPQIQARVQRHLDETRMHEQRMADRLTAFNESPSTKKSVGSSLMGNLIGAAAGSRTDALSKAARDDYMTEHMEIAAYELLIATAQAFGDNETIQAAQANLRDEIRMAAWLEEHLPETVVYSLQEDGIALDKAAIPVIQRVVMESLQQARSGLSGVGGMGAMAGSNMANTMNSAGSGVAPAGTMPIDTTRRNLQSESSLDASGSQLTGYPNEETPGTNPAI